MGIYKHAERIEPYRDEFLAHPGIKPADKKLVDRFVQEYGTAKNHEARTSYKYFSYFKSVLLFLKKPIGELTYQDYLDFRRALMKDELRKTGSRDGVKFSGQPYTESSKEDFDALLRRVLRWHKKYAPREAKDEIEKILEEQPYKQDKDKVDQPDVLTEPEILKVVQMTPDARDRAIIAVLWETGMRTEELLTLTVGDISPLQYSSADHGLQLRMRQSKTTLRTLPLIESAPYLQAYLNQHSRNKESDAPLWLSKQMKALEYGAMRKAVLAATERAKIKKRIYNHLFRHSRATYLANKGWSEAQLCAWFGWKIGSDMPATYIRRSGINLTNAALEMHGLKVKEEAGKALLLPRECYFCKHPNPQTNEYCEKCHKPLDATKIAQREQTSADMINALVEAKLNEILGKHGLVKDS